MAPPTLALQTENLTKTFRTGFWLRQKVTSLNQVSLTVYGGGNLWLTWSKWCRENDVFEIGFGDYSTSGGGGDWC